LTTERGEKILQPTPSERATYAQFLKQQYVGLVRLRAQSGGVVSVEELSKDKPPAVSMFPGGGAFYSFTKLNHLPGDWADIKLNVGNLEVAFRPSESNDAKNEYRRFKAGVTLAGYSFQTLAPVHENTTYMLRSIAYGRSDLLVAVRIVKQDSDGSVLLLWKRIEKFSTPKLKAATRK
jgi:hypothetical protein